MTYPRRFIYKLFIGTAGGPADHQRLVRLLDAQPDFRWEDLALAPCNSPAELRRRMREADAVLLLAANEPAELELAQELGRPIIAVSPRGERAASPSLRRVADEVVGWNARLMIDSIRQYAVPA